MNNPIDEVSQAERRRIIENDRKVMATYHSHAQSTLNDERQGRFATLDKPTVTGSTPGSQFPRMPAGNPWREEPIGPEPFVDGRGEGNVLGYAIDRPDAPPSSASPVGDGGNGDRAITATGSPVIRSKFRRRI